VHGKAAGYAAAPEATPARRAIPALAARLVQLQTRPRFAAEVSGLNLACLDVATEAVKSASFAYKAPVFHDQNLDENQLVPSPRRSAMLK
jgi:hypothetical protein